MIIQCRKNVLDIPSSTSPQAYTCTRRIISVWSWARISRVIISFIIISISPTRARRILSWLMRVSRATPILRRRGTFHRFATNRTGSRPFQPLLKTFFVQPVRTIVELHDRIGRGVIIQTDWTPVITIACRPILERASLHARNNISRCSFGYVPEDRTEREQAFIRIIKVFVSHKIAHSKSTGSRPPNPPRRVYEFQIIQIQWPEE